MVSKGILAGLFALLLVAGCTTYDGAETINGQTVRVAHDSSGNTIRSFTLPNRTGLNVKRQGNQVVVSHVIEYPLSQAEAAYYVNAATGCTIGPFLGQYSTQYNGAINKTYGLSCIK